MWGSDGERNNSEGRGAEGAAIADRLGDHLGRHLTKGIPLQVPATRSPRGVGGACFFFYCLSHSFVRGGWQTYTHGVEMEPGCGLVGLKLQAWANA